MQEDGVMYEDDIEPVEGADESPRPATVMTDLRAKREAIARERTTDLNVPGYDGQLVLRMYAIDWDTLRGIGRRAEAKLRGNPRMPLYVHADTIAAATRDILFREQPEAEPVSLGEAAGEGEAVRFGSPILTSVLGLKEGASGMTVRQSVLQTFNDDVAVSNFHNEYIEWRNVAADEDDEEALGESRGTTP